MLVFQLPLLFGLLSICSFGPGFYCVRKLPWTPLEKLCGSIGLSLVLTYLVAWGIYCAAGGENVQTAAFMVWPAVSLALVFVTRHDALRLFRALQVRRALAGQGFLLLWSLLMLAIIRNYSGLGWGSDWLEHFQRSLFFLHRFPASTPIIEGYQLPARPPMMNMLAAFFMALTEDRFELFQIIFTFFNALLFLACCLFLPALGMSRRPRVTPLVALFACNPVFMEQVTYSWTKSLASFFVVLSLWFYLAGLRKRGGMRLTAAFASAAAGVLVHYLAGPYLLFLTLHYLIFVFWKRADKWRELAAIAIPGALLLSSWFVWSLANFGPAVTFKSNSSVTSAQQYQGNNLIKIGMNLWDTIIPIQLRSGSLVYATSGEPNLAGRIRDNTFAFYQPNLILAMGVIGGPFVVWLLYRFYRRRTLFPPEWHYWRAMIPFCVLTGIAVVGERDIFGSAHLTLLPLIALGLGLIAASFPWSRVAAVLLIAGCIADFGAGVFLQAHIESLENSPARTVFTAAVRPSTGTFRRGSLRPEGLSVSAWENWFAKHRFTLCRQVLKNLEGYQSNNTQGLQDAARVRAKMQTDLAEDASSWHGWWERHGYELSFLGDAAADATGGGGLLEFLLLAVFGGLMTVLLRQLAAKPVRRRPAPVRVAAGRKMR